MKKIILAAFVSIIGLSLFAYDISASYDTNEFTLKVAPQGNYMSNNEKGLISSVDGKYVTEITDFYTAISPKSIYPRLPSSFP